MSFAAPWALIGLASLPLLWWWHVRRKRPPLVDTPSLMFVLDEEEQTRLPRGRRFDWELFLTLAGAALLTLAAAGPRWQSERPHRVVRVVVAGGALATRAGYEQAVTETLERMGAALEPGDSLDVRWLPERDPASAWRWASRPAFDALLGAARAGVATVRYVVSDRLPDEQPEDIAWIALGDPEAVNAGIVSVRVTRDASGPRMFVVVQKNDPAHEVAVVLNEGVDGRPTPLRPGTNSAGTVDLPFSGAPEVRVSLATDDDLSADNHVALMGWRPSVHVAPTLPVEVRQALQAALAAAMGVRTVEQAPLDAAELVFGPQGSDSGEHFVGLTFAPTDAPPVLLPDGDDVVSTALLARDLSLRGVAWQFPTVPDPVDDDRILLGRVVEGKTWPVLVREGERGIRLLSLPPPRNVPFWPLLVENVLDSFMGQTVGGGYRALGVLDRNVTRIGRDVQPFNAAALRAVPPDRMPATTDLRVLCLVLGLLAIGLLWVLPAFRRAPDAFMPAYAE